jgi:hypothetical protein
LEERLAQLTTKTDERPQIDRMATATPFPTTT